MKRDAIEMEYLLGKLSESEAERFEQRYFDDEALFDEIETAEDDLIDAYVRDQLSGDDRKRFETKLLSSKRIAERVEFAKLFSKSGFVSPAVVEPPKPGWWANLFSYSWVPNSALSGALAAVLLLMVVGIPGSIAWMKLRNESNRVNAERAALEQQKQQLEREITDRQAKTNQLNSDLQTATDQQNKLQQRLKELEERLARQTRPPASSDSVPAIVSALLFPSFSPRGAGEPKEVSVPASAANIKFRLVLDAHESKSYTATLQSPANDNICSRENLRPRRSGKNWIIELQCASQLVESGNYLVRVSGLKPSGASEEIAGYRFRISKK